MLVKRGLSPRVIYEFAGHHILWLTGWMLTVTLGYYFTHLTFFTLPTLPITLIGTVVAFYVGFKNSEAYDRLWEARKIWGALVNDSRKLGVLIKSYKDEAAEEGTDNATRRRIILRHIAYLYQLREQLLVPAEWEHVAANGNILNARVGRYNRKRRRRYESHYRNELEKVSQRMENYYLTPSEKEYLKSYSNKATQILDLQTQDIQKLYERKSINYIQQVKIQDILNNFYDGQGMCERIKKFPIPRKYAGFSYIFTGIFVFLLPFGLVGEFSKLGDIWVLMSIPLSVIVGWIYVVMEMIGDYSEFPFQGLHNDIPMLSICRVIEIDMLQMIGEDDIPPGIESKHEHLI